MAREIKNLLINYILNKEIRISASKFLKGKLIDIGCGTKPYREMLAEFVDEHVGLDQHQSMHDQRNIDLFGTAYKIPAPDGAFDSAICTAVLEHLEEPSDALRECHRVLKKGCFALYTIPFIWHLHEEPRDFYRFSKHGIVYLFQKAGFEIVVLKPLSGFWVTFGQLLVYNLYRLKKGPIRWLGIIDMLGLLMQLSFFIMDKIDRTEQWTWMYLVVAQKQKENVDG